MSKVTLPVDLTNNFSRDTTPETQGKFPINLYKKIHAIIKEGVRVGKDGRNEFHKYDYVTEADVVEVMTTVFSKHNLAYDFDIVEAFQVIIDGKEITRVKAKITLVDLDSGEYKINTIYGDGADKSDKGLYKSYTGLQKYYFMKSFLMATGDDPELDGAIKTNSKQDIKTPSSAPNRGFNPPQRNTTLVMKTPAVEANSASNQQVNVAPAAPTPGVAPTAPAQNTANSAQVAETPAVPRKRAVFAPPKRQPAPVREE